MKNQRSVCLLFPAFAVAVFVGISCTSDPQANGEKTKKDGVARAEDKTGEKNAQKNSKDENEKDASLVLGQKFGNVENGSAYDKAIVKVSAGKKIVLPDTATIRQDGEGDGVQVFMKKTLSFGGHPPARMSIKEARKNMGCATQDENRALVLATFGEWNSHIEGAARMKLLIIVPKGIEVEKRPKLAGEDSIASTWRKADAGKSLEPINGHWWYGPANPGDGWDIIKAFPDSDRRAE